MLFFHQEVVVIGAFFTISPFTFFGLSPGRGGTPYNGLYGEAPPESGTFFGLQVYEKVGILLVEVCEMVGKSVIWVCERSQRAEHMSFMAL